MITFLEPGYLLLLLLVPLYLLAAWRQAVIRRRQQERLFPGSGKRGKSWRSYYPPLIFALSGGLLILALAGPVHYRKVKVFKRRGLAIAVCLDVSKSMLAEDVPAPSRNRIDRARQLVLQLLDRLDGESLGVGVFAAEGLELVPLTRDYGYCRYLVENLDAMAVSAPGSSLAAGLESGENLLAAGRQPGEKGAGVIILFSDGEDLGTEPGRALKLAESLRRKGRVIYAVGIGRKAPSLIPIRTPDGREIIDYYRDAHNNFLTTARRDDLLQKIAAGGGRFFRPGRKPETAAKLLGLVLQHASATGRARVEENRALSLAPWFLALSFVGFVLALAGPGRPGI